MSSELMFVLGFDPPHPNVGRVPAWDNQERSALTVPSFKVFQQLFSTNKRGER